MAKRHLWPGLGPGLTQLYHLWRQEREPLHRANVLLRADISITLGQAVAAIQRGTLNRSSCILVSWRIPVPATLIAHKTLQQWRGAGARTAHQ